MRPKKKQHVFLIVGRFQPLHNRHLHMINESFKHFGVPCILCQVKGKKPNINSPFPKYIAKNYISKLKNNNKHIVRHYFFNNGYLPNIIKELETKGFKVVGLSCGNDRYDGYIKQLPYFQKENLKEYDNFEIWKVPESHKNLRGTDIRNYIKNDKFELFKEKTPKEIHDFFEIFKKYVKDK